MELVKSALDRYDWKGFLLCGIERILIFVLAAAALVGMLFLIAFLGTAEFNIPSRFITAAGIAVIAGGSLVTVSYLIVCALCSISKKFRRKCRKLGIR